MFFTPYIVHGYFILPFVSLVISAKWTRELGYGLLWQLVAGICGFVLGPIMLLLLYLRGAWLSRRNPKPVAFI
ncbi:MAG: hypothetical protein ACRD4A_10600 [Candidatus Acidiferrales bacterium]